MTKFDKNIFEYNLYENLTEDMEFDQIWLTNKMKTFKVSEDEDFNMELEFKNSFLNYTMQNMLDKMTPYGSVRWFAIYNVLYNALCKLYDVEIPWMKDDYDTVKEALSEKIVTCTLTVINPLNPALQDIYSKLLGLKYISSENAMECFDALMNYSINAKSVKDAIIDIVDRVRPVITSDNYKIDVIPITAVTSVAVDRYDMIHVFPMEYHVKISSDSGCVEEFNTKALLFTVDPFHKYYGEPILNCSVTPAKDDAFLYHEIYDIYQYVSSLITDPEYTIDPEITIASITTDLTVIGEYINAATEDCRVDNIEIEQGYQFYFNGALRTIFSMNTTDIPDVTPGYTDWDDYDDDDDDEDDLEDDEEEDENYDEDDDE